MRAIVEDLYCHRDDRALSGTEQYFVSCFLQPSFIGKLDSLDVERFAGHAELPDDSYDTVTAFKAGWILAFDDNVLRFLLSQIEQLNVRRALSGIHGQFTGKFLRHLGAPERLRAQQQKILSFAKHVRLLDLFRTLQSFLLTIQERQGSYFLDDDEIRPSSVPLDLGSYYETFRRNRSGSAVFIDLIGFTNKTREVFFGAARGSAARDMEQSERGELAALALERLFQVRKELQQYDGRPEGFEGDAILDIFPEPLSALRYVNRFRANYRDNRLVQFRPFSQAVKNPFAQEGFRVGIATGDYTLVNVPDIDSSGELQVRLRAIGPSINKASRLNTGKRGVTEQFITSTREQSGDGKRDPLQLFQVQVVDEDLNNTGICIDVHTLDELMAVVLREELPCWMPRGDMTFEIDGRDAVPSLYTFDLIIHDVEHRTVYALRRLPRVPRLKGLNRSESVVIEVLPFSVEDYQHFVTEDRRLAADAGDSVVTPESSVSSGSRLEEEGHLSAELPEYLFGRSGRQDAASTPAPAPEADPSDAWSAEPVDEERLSADSLEEVLGGDGRVSLDASFADSDEDLVSGSWDAVDPATSTGPNTEEEWDDAELHKYMNDVLDAIGDEISEDVSEDVSVDRAAFDGPLDLPGAEPVAANSGPVADTEAATAETEPERPVVPAPAESGVAPSDASRPSAWIEEMPDVDGLDGLAAPEADFSEDSWVPSARSTAAAATSPDDEMGVLGPLDDAFAARLAQLRGKDKPGTGGDAAVSVDGPLGRGELQQALEDYHYVVRVLEGKQEVLFGRLVGSSLFDLHQYVLPSRPGAEPEFDQALQLFLEDKVREDFLPYSTRYGDLPADASEPVPVPLDRAFTVLRGIG